MDADEESDADRQTVGQSHMSTNRKVGTAPGSGLRLTLLALSP